MEPFRKPKKWPRKAAPGWFSGREPSWLPCGSSVMKKLESGLLALDWPRLISLAEPGRQAIPSGDAIASALGSMNNQRKNRSSNEPETRTIPFPRDYAIKRTTRRKGERKRKGWFLSERSFTIYVPKMWVLSKSVNFGIFTGWFRKESWGQGVFSLDRRGVNVIFFACDPTRREAR
jgi:hypothetical protein